MRVMIAGGGTGGHVYPGVAIYRSLETLYGDLEALFVGARGGVESGIFTRLGLPHLLLPGRGLRGASVFSKLVAPFVLKWSVIQAIRAITSFKPDVVIGTGGYASVSTVTAAALCGKMRVLQEQNSVPGLANRVLSRFANLVLLAYEESRAYLPARVPSLVVGNPLRVGRSDQPKAPSREAMLEFFGFTEGLPVVLVFGGSRGALSINRAGLEAAKEIVHEGKSQFLFLTGERDFEWVRRDMETYASAVKVVPFIEEMERAYAVADLAVARAGALSVVELAAFGVPSVFVPYPYAADDHQQKNVAPLESIGAAVVVKDSELNGEALAAILRTLLENKEECTRMSERMKSWSKTDAAENAAKAIADLVRSFETEIPMGENEPLRGTNKIRMMAHVRGSNPTSRLRDRRVRASYMSHP